MKKSEITHSHLQPALLSTALGGPGPDQSAPKDREDA